VTVPAVGTAPLDNPDHTAEHQRIATQLANDLPRGIIAYTIGSAQGQAITTTTTLYTLSAVTLLARRMYLWAFTLRALQYNAAQNVQFTFAGTTIKHSLMYADLWKTNVAGAAHDCVYWEQPFWVDSDVTIPTITLQINAANANIWTNNCFLLIRDIGPYKAPV
jgi:hypothetical protein